MLQLQFSRQARQDLEDIWFQIARNDAAVADKISLRIEHRLEQLTRHPEMAPRREDISPDMRALVIERWLALDRLRDDTIQIVRIVDGSRDVARIATSGAP